MIKKKNRSTRVVIPQTDRIRQPGASGFGWLDVRLYKQGWFELLTPEDIATYTFLCLVANRQGVSWYRRDRIGQALSMGERNIWRALDRLKALDLIAYQPFGKHASEGFHQVLSLPPQDPPELFPQIKHEL